jgi:hypothetical protein
MEGRSSQPTKKKKRHIPHSELSAEQRAKKQSRARECYARNREKYVANKREIRRLNPDKVRRANLKAAYGITPEEYDALFSSQGFACAVCLTQEPETKTKWHLDHCHSTGKVRGILCHHCNLMLGNAKDDPERLKAAVAYLERNT